MAGRLQKHPQVTAFHSHTPNAARLNLTAEMPVRQQVPGNSFGKPRVIHSRHLVSPDGSELCLGPWGARRTDVHFKEISRRKEDKVALTNVMDTYRFLDVTLSGGCGPLADEASPK